MKTFEILRKHSISLDKRRGQCFVIDNAFIEREVNYAGVSGKDTVLEIGAGVGNLTEALSRNAKKVIAIEKDPKLCGILRSHGFLNVDVIQGDALRVDIPEFDKCISNIPYEISSDVTEMLLRRGKLSVICYQKEFALRLIAKPSSKDYSRLSILSSFFSDTRILENVPRGIFYPPPDVDSSLVILSPKKPAFNADEPFWKIVKALFMHKNQTVRNSLVHSAKFLGMDKDSLKALSGGVFDKFVSDCDINDFHAVCGNLGKTI